MDLLLKGTGMSDLKTMMLQVLDLDQGDRIRLVKWILDHSDIIDPEVEKLWVAEAELRYAAYKRGELQTVDWEDIKAEFGR